MRYLMVAGLVACLFAVGQAGEVVDAELPAAEAASLTLKGRADILRANIARLEADNIKHRKSIEFQKRRETLALDAGSAATVEDCRRTILRLQQYITGGEESLAEMRARLALLDAGKDPNVAPADTPAARVVAAEAAVKACEAALAAAKAKLEAAKQAAAQAPSPAPPPDKPKPVMKVEVLPEPAEKQP